MNEHRVLSAGVGIVALVCAALFATSCTGASAPAGDPAGVPGGDIQVAGERTGASGDVRAASSGGVDRDVSSVRVPRLTGRFFFHAKRALDASGLSYDSVSVAKGGNSRRVAKQDPAPGVEVPEGYTVSLVLETAPPRGGRAIGSLSAATAGLVSTGSSASKSDGGTSGGSGTGSTGGGDTSKPKSTTTTAPPKVPKISLAGSSWGSALAAPTLNFEVENKGSATGYCVSVTGRAYDASGTEVGSATDLAAPVKVAPGASAYGRLKFETLPSGPLTIKYSYTWSNSGDGCTAFSLDVSGTSLVTMPSGKVAVSGVVKNNYVKTPVFTYVLAAAYDSLGKLQEVSMIELDSTFLYPGGSVPFLAEFDYTKSMTKYVVVAQGI